MKKVTVLLAVVVMFLLSCSNPSGPNGGGGGGDGKYTLTVYVSPAGAGTVNPASASYAPGTQATVTAIPASGYTFIRWTGASTSTSNQITVTMNGDKTLTAMFEKMAASAVIITLTHWETKATDLLDSKLDPRIHFEIMSYQNGTRVSNNKTGYLLDAENVGQSWSGYVRSGAVSFVGSADQLRIYAVVMEKDPLDSDDISPTEYTWINLPVSVGKSGTHTLGTSTKTESKVSFDYEFVQ